MERFTSTLSYLFGCRHSHLSRVFTIDRMSYKVCFDCGSKFHYSLRKMSIERRFRPIETQRVLLGEAKA